MSITIFVLSSRYDKNHDNNQYFLSNLWSNKMSNDPNLVTEGLADFKKNIVIIIYEVN